MEIISYLRELKLAWIVKSFELRNKEAIERKLSYIEFLELLVNDEKNNRENNSIKKRRQIAHLPNNKTLEEYDFNFQPQINKRLIFELATCNFIPKAENIIFMWQQWTQKNTFSFCYST